MKIDLLAFDSFSNRSMATIIETDVKIAIDPSVAIAPKRYGLSPSQIELEELNKKIDEISKLKFDIGIITHYHWDHCPNPNEKHFDIFKNNNFFLIKDYNKTNKSQNFRAKKVINKAREINNKIKFKIADNKTFEFNNTLIEFSKPLNHGPTELLGKVFMVKVSFKDDNIVFASDIQGINDNETLNELLKMNPKILIMSGPATYHYKWQERFTKISIQNTLRLIEKTQVKTIILDHHLLRDLNYKEKMKKLYEKAEIFGCKIMTAAEFMGKENLQLEAYRRELIKLA